MRGKIFISYRREDARADARSIYQRLQRSAGADQLFMDVNSIPRGSDFRTLIDRYLRQCRVMLVVIGQRWLDARDEDGRRRLDDPSDFVRIELAMALARKIAVIPVLVDGAKLPKQADLPDDLKPLVFRQSATVRHETFARDLEVLERDVSLLIAPRFGRRAIAGSLAALALVAASVWAWPMLSSQLTRSSAPLALPGRPSYGVQSAQVPTWQNEVRALSLRIDDSPAVGRASALAERLKILSKGQIEFAFETSANGPDRLETLSKGTLDAVWEVPTYWWRQSISLVLFSGQAPLGLDTRRVARWLADRGTREINLIYQERLGLRVLALPCRISPADGIWFRNKLESASDLKGLTIRTREVFLIRMAPRLGFNTVSLSSTEFLQSLGKGALDGGEYASPKADFQLGLGKAARYYYYPSFHSPTAVTYLHINLDRWKALDAAARGLIEEACRAQVESDMQRNDEDVQAGIVRLKTQGVQVLTLPSDILVAADRAMRETVEEIAAKDADFRSTWASYSSYR